MARGSGSKVRKGQWLTEAHEVIFCLHSRPRGKGEKVWGVQAATPYLPLYVPPCQQIRKTASLHLPAPSYVHAAHGRYGGNL